MPQVRKTLSHSYPNSLLPKTSLSSAAGVDIWATECILAELLLRIPFLAGETDLDQLAKIFQAMGTPTEESWPNHTKLPDYVLFKTYPATPLQVCSTFCFVKTIFI